MTRKKPPAGVKGCCTKCGCWPCWCAWIKAQK